MIIIIIAHLRAEKNVAKYHAQQHAKEKGARVKSIIIGSVVKSPNWTAAAALAPARSKGPATARKSPVTTRPFDHTVSMYGLSINSVCNVM